jgi:glutathione S-transferase
MRLVARQRSPLMVVKQAEQASAGQTGGSPDAAPVLWHLKVSNYNEKARWALDYKGVPHVRYAAVPGRHAAIAKRLTSGRTFPVLVLQHEVIGDSTRIIEALERRYPEPALYPADPVARQRALDLEDFFDEELGPHVRLLVVHHMLPNASLTLGAFAPDLAGVRRLVARAKFPAVRRRFIAALAITPRSVDLAYEKVRAAGQRFQRELQPSGYLVGDGFTVADLALAALVAPAVAPQQFPYPQPQRGHALLAPLRDALSEYGVLDWTRETYARHRGASSELRQGTADRRSRGERMNSRRRPL